MVRNTYEVQNIGDLLREKRKQLGKSISDISEHTKIRAEYLLALESGKYEKFAASVYAKGFLKKYAKYLGISPERAVALYRREKNSQDNAAIKKQQLQFTENFRPNIEISPARVAIAIVGIVFIAFVYYIFSQINVVLKPPLLSLNSPIAVAAGGSETATVNLDTVTVQGRVDLGSRLKVNDSEVNLNNLEQFEVVLNNLQEGENRFSFIARSQFGQESQLVILVNRTIGPITTTPPTSVAGVSTGLNLEVGSKVNTTYVQIEADGRRVFADNLNQDSAEQFQAQESFRISSARPADVTISINEQTFTLSNSRPHTFSIKADGTVQMQVN